MSPDNTVAKWCGDCSHGLNACTRPGFLRTHSMHIALVTVLRSLLFPVARAAPNSPTPHLPTVQCRRFVYNHGRVVAVDHVVSLSSTRVCL